MLEKQKKYRSILRFIERFSDKKGYPPTLAEIAAFSGVSVSTAGRYVKTLSEGGYIKKPDGKKRSVSVKKQSAVREAIKVPVYSEISADGTLEKENFLYSVFIPKKKFHDGKYFGLYADGEMILPKGTAHGDHLIFENTKRAKNGDFIIIKEKEKVSFVRISFEENGFSLSYKNGTVKTKKEVEIIGKLCAVQKLDI